jgi:hypothetical protein
VYSFGGETGKRVARIWRNSSNTVVAGPFDVPCVGITGWIELDLPQPLSIEADVLYTVSVSTADDPNKVYPLSANFFAAAGGNDKSLTFPAGAGVFGTWLGTRPSQTAPNNSFYFRDVVFVPGSVPPENVIIWALDLPVRLGRVETGPIASWEQSFARRWRNHHARPFCVSPRSRTAEITQDVWKNPDGS